MKFWDSSAILPLIVQESSSGLLRKLHKADTTMLVWWATLSEVTSALSRLTREEKMGSRELEYSLSRLKILRESWSEIQPTEDILITSQRLLLTHGLRAADSLQLAAIIVACSHRPSIVDFVCLDKRLIQAAKKEGCIVLP